MFIPNWLRKAADRIEEWLIVACYVYFCFIILMEVVLRFVFGLSTQWGEMTARYAFIFLSYFAMIQVAKSRSHVRIDLVPTLLSARGRLILYLYFDVFQIILAAFVVYFSLRTINLQIVNRTMMASADFNLAFAYIALPIGWGLLCVRIVERAQRMYREYLTTAQVQVGGGEYGE